TFVNTGAGNDTVNVHNDLQQLSDLRGLLTVSGDSPQANVVNFANGSPKQGTAVDAVDAIQMLTVDATGGTYAITYAPRPLGLTAGQGVDAGTLAAGTYFYQVTATICGAETLPSGEVFSTVTGTGSVDLGWSPVPGATGYTVYRGTSAGAENTKYAASSETFTDTNAPGASGTPPATSATVQSTTVAWNVSATDLKNALGTLIGGSGNVEVQKAGDVYRIHFQGSTFGGTPIALLLTDPTALTNGAGESDTLNIVDTSATANDAAVLTSSSLTGLDMPAPNTIQQLVIDATGGTFTLDYSFPVFPTSVMATAGLAGSLTAGSHYYVVTAMVGGLETITSSEVSAVTAGGGSVALTWTWLGPVASGYRVYRGDHAGGETEYLTSAGTSLIDTGALATGGTPPTSSTVVATVRTTALDYNATAGQVQTALETVAGVANVVVTRNDDIYTIRFQGSLSDTAVNQLAAHSSLLSKKVELLGGAVRLDPGTAVVSTRPSGYTTPPTTNQVQLLTVDATAGSYRLSFHVNGVAFQTAPIPFNAGAEALRQAIQNAIAAGETTDANLQLYLRDAIDVTVDRYPSGNWYNDKHLDIYVLNFQGMLRKDTLGPGLDTVAVDGT
ncbi:MAG TPA: hypothetical protein VEQ67_26435, partial [Mycobacterium sp.]|nr:hypothetical protein [Mycobacterium sp.]